MAKTVETKAATEVRSYVLSRETKGTWVYAWEDAPAETPDWAKKWYILKPLGNNPKNPGGRLKVTITPA
jgi:hypothetical protein